MMLPFILNLPWLWKAVLATVLFVCALNVYLSATKGVCTSTNRLSGKTVIVTGANTGMGWETALDLAKRGARVILACRDMKKATAARDAIIRVSGNGNVLAKELNLASLASVRKFAAEIVKEEAQLHVLINNAGCVRYDSILTEDGLELQMQSNYFGHFLLTLLLLELMVATENARIINVSSDVHEQCRSLDLDDLNFIHHTSIGVKSFFQIYGASKLCVILFTKQLAIELASLGKSITVNCLHPGATQTDILHFSPILNLLWSTLAFFVKIKTPKEGAQTTIYLAVADEVANTTGKYFSDCKVRIPSKLAEDSELAKKLWELSEKLVQLQPEERPSFLTH